MHQKYKTIQYVGGWFSLFLFLLLCLWQIKHDDRAVPRRMIEMNFCDLKPSSDPRFYPPKREYTTIILNDNEEINERKFTEIRHLMSKLRIEHDTIHGIDLIFGNQCKFRNWVKALDFLEKENQKYYGLSENHIYIIHTEPKSETEPEIGMFFCGTMMYMTSIDSRTASQQFYDRYLAESISFILNYPLVFGMWLLLAVLSVWKIPQVIKRF